MKLKLLSLFTLLCFSTFAQVPNYVPQSGLRCFYPFSGNSNDVSAAASHLVNSGAVLTTDRFGAISSAYSFNGTSQSMSTTTPNFTFSSSSSFTISVWIQKNSTAGGVALINGTTTAGNFIWLLQGGTSSMTFGTNKQQQAWVYVNSPFTVSTWEHYVCVYNNGAMTFYKNNVVEGTGTFSYTGVTSANLPFYVGKGISGGYFNGKIDDLGIWDRALTSCEIANLYNSTATVTSVNAGVDQTVCSGQNVTLTGSGAFSYTWDQGVTNGTSFIPSSTATYTVTGMDTNGCSGWDQINVNVNQGLVNAGADQLICDGAPVTLTATGATGISWDNGVQDGVAFVPVSSGTYTVSGTDTAGCTGTDQVVVTLYQPNVNAGSDITICEGVPVTLAASGAANYAWSNGVTNGVAYVPSTSGYYSVTGTDTAGCAGMDSLLITLKPLPVIDGGGDLDICPGDLITLSGSGGLFYTWTNGVFNNVPFIPISSNMYVVTGTGANNCTSNDTIQVTINQPTSSTITINAIDQYDLNGTIYSASGTYTQVLQNAAGCDSTITLNLNLDFTGISEINKYNLKWFPNPAQDILNLSFDVDLVGKTVLFYAMDGKLVKTIFLTNEQVGIDIKDLEKGVYTGQIEGDKPLVFKWIKK